MSWVRNGVVIVVFYGFVGVVRWVVAAWCWARHSFSWVMWVVFLISYSISSDHRTLHCYRIHIVSICLALSAYTIISSWVVCSRWWIVSCFRVPLPMTISLYVSSLFIILPPLDIIVLFCIVIVVVLCTIMISFCTTIS